MRALKLGPVLFVFVFVLLLTNAQSVHAQLNTYQMGPYHVEGFGVTSGEAVTQAYEEMWDLIFAIETTLPPNHFVLAFQVISQGHTNANTYVIDFYVIIWEPTPPGPPNRI